MKTKIYRAYTNKGIVDFKLAVPHFIGTSWSTARLIAAKTFGKYTRVTGIGYGYRNGYVKAVRSVTL